VTHSTNARRAELVRYWLPALAWIGIVAFTSSQAAAGSFTLMLLRWMFDLLQIQVNHETLVAVHMLIRKVGHFVNYAILSTLLFRAIRVTAVARTAWRPQWTWLAIIATLIIASADELHQYFTPFREGRWQDVAIDMAGASFAQLLIWAWLRRRSASSDRNAAALVEEHEQA
jgi:VanZ family protein